MIVREVLANGNGLNYTRNATYYHTIGTGALLAANTARSQREIKFKTAGTLANLYVNNTGGNVTNATFSVVVNGSTSILSFTLPSTAGVTEDTDAVSIAADDMVCFALYGGSDGSSAKTVTVVAVDWNATATNTQHLTNQANYSQSQLMTRYMALSGNALNVTATQTNAEWKIQLPSGLSSVTFTNLYASFSANSFVGTMTITLVGATGAGTAPSIQTTPASGAVNLEDVINSIVANNGDTLSFSIVTSAGTGTVTLSALTIEYTASSSCGFWIQADPNGIAVPGGTRYHAVAGNMVTAVTTETNVNVLARMTGTGPILGLLTANVTNAGTGATLTLRANAGNTGVAVTMNSVGWVTDTTHTYSAADTDDMTLSTVTTTGPTIRCIAVTLWAIDTITVTARHAATVDYAANTQIPVMSAFAYQQIGMFAYQAVSDVSTHLTSQHSIPLDSTLLYMSHLEYTHDYMTSVQLLDEYTFDYTDACINTYTMPAEWQGAVGASVIVHAPFVLDYSASLRSNDTIAFDNKLLCSSQHSVCVEYQSLWRDQYSITLDAVSSHAFQLSYVNDNVFSIRLPAEYALDYMQSIRTNIAAVLQFVAQLQSVSILSADFIVDKKLLQSKVVLVYNQTEQLYQRIIIEWDGALIIEVLSSIMYLIQDEPSYFVIQQKENGNILVSTETCKVIM